MARVLVTGAAGFIGSHLAEAVARDGRDVVALDCLTDYYDPSLKRENLGGRCHGWNPVRALFIGPYIDNAIKGWWRRNKSGTSDRCAVSEELRRIAGGDARVTVSAALKHWMAEHGDEQPVRVA